MLDFKFRGFPSDHTLQLLLVLAQHFLDSPAFGNIGVRAKPLNDVALGIFEGCPSRQERTKFAVSAAQRELHFERLAGSNAGLPFF